MPAIKLINTIQLIFTIQNGSISNCSSIPLGCISNCRSRKWFMRTQTTAQPRSGVSPTGNWSDNLKRTLSLVALFCR